MGLKDAIEQQLPLSEMDEKSRHYADSGKAIEQLSHAIKNMLQMVGGAAEVIDYALQAKQMNKFEKSWGILNLHFRRLRKNLLDIMDFTKKQSLDKCKCDINDELNQTLKSLKWITAYKRFKIRMHLDPEMPEVEVDPERISLMALNMLLSAVDRVDETEGVIQLKTVVCPTLNQFEISVIDNTLAYPDQMQERFFTPHETHHQRFSTGIGLALAQQIAVQHGGRLELVCADRNNRLAAIIPIRSA